MVKYYDIWLILSACYPISQGKRILTPIVAWVQPNENYNLFTQTLIVYNLLFKTKGETRDKN